MKMYLISDNIDTLTGMRLAGVEGAVVHKREELKEELDKALADKNHRDHPADRKVRQGISGDHRQCKAGAQASADCGDSGPPWNRPQAGLYHLLCERGNRTETVVMIERG